MNFYQHHIGDYVRDTAHLSAVEDGIYRRALDWYYAKEKPLPLDRKEVCRALRAKTKIEIAAVDAVLNEFFKETEQGYRQKRCDIEITKYVESEPEREEKKINEKERQRRTRERRKELFADLSTYGIVPVYDTPMSQLKEMLSHAMSQQHVTPVTRDSTVTSQCFTNVDTATQIPITKNQEPIINTLSSDAGPDFWNPPLKDVNAWFVRAGLSVTDQVTLDQELITFNLRNSDQLQTDRQRYGALITWFKNKKQFEARASGTVKPKAGAVNEQYEQQIIAAPEPTAESAERWAEFQRQMSLEEQL